MKNIEILYLLPFLIFFFLVTKREGKNRNNNNNCGFRKWPNRSKLRSSGRKKKIEKELKGRSHLGWSAERVHKRGQTTRTIPICQPLFAEINSRDVRWMQLPRRIGARMHFFAPSRVKRDRKNFAPPPEATGLVCKTPPLERRLTSETRDCDLFIPEGGHVRDFWNKTIRHSVYCK